MEIEDNTGLMEYWFVSDKGQWEQPDELHEIEHHGNVLLIHYIHEVINSANRILVGF